MPSMSQATPVSPTASPDSNNSTERTCWLLLFKVFLADSAPIDILLVLAQANAQLARDRDNIIDMTL